MWWVCVITRTDGRSPGLAQQATLMHGSSNRGGQVECFFPQTETNEPILWLVACFSPLVKHSRMEQGLVPRRRNNGHMEGETAGRVHGARVSE